MRLFKSTFKSTRAFASLVEALKCDQNQSFLPIDKYASDSLTTRALGFPSLPVSHVSHQIIHHSHIFVLSKSLSHKFIHGW